MKALARPSPSCVAPSAFALSLTLTLTLAVAASFLQSSPSLIAAEAPPALKKPVSLFDGKTLNGWEGDAKIWRVQDGTLTGGSLTETVKQNEFLATTRDYTNFVIHFKIRLLGSNGFINSGFQIRSQRVPNNSEMSGYQCDFGEPNWYGAIYDESRRNKVMAASDMKSLRPVLRKDDWNDYVIRAVGPRVTTWINGAMGVDFHEPDLTIPNYNWGKLGIQVHGGGKAIVQVKDIVIEELPASEEFRGAPPPKKGAKASPLTPDEERAEFTLPPGFEIELVAGEDTEAGFGKFVAIDWDLQGRLWTMTALEYPVDANENPEAARELYASKAKDKVLVYDRDPQSPTGYARKPRVFADGLAIPLGILPYKNGVYVQHGTEIVFLSDTDGDGRADKRETILSGFGVQDSHLFPHQFTRAPGNWIWMAQGAFNYGKVKTKRGSEVQFDQTRMAKFRYDGSDFDITSQGPCNIWGLVLDGKGQAWIQEANDFGYPMMPFHEYANYPGCSGGQWKSYAPEFPGTAPDFQMGGTGLSGLALSDSPTTPPGDKDGKARAARTSDRAWPSPYAGKFYVANPITRKIQAIEVTPDGTRFRYQKLPDFVLSSDEWFRPVALRTGPDGCLYIVDWYNKIISHNEVPRNHPERDKKRGRIWRVKHQVARPHPVPDFTQLSGEELLARLGGVSVPQSHMAWQAITDRRMTELTPRLEKIVQDRDATTSRRLAALWALEGLDGADQKTPGSEWFKRLQPMLGEPDRNLRREALRVLGTRPPSVAGASKTWGNLFDALEPLTNDADPEVRAEVIKTLHRLSTVLGLSSDNRTAALAEERALPLLLQLARPALAEPTMKSTQSGRTIKIKEAYDREFERYLVRLRLESSPGAVASFLDSKHAAALPLENRLLASLSLEPAASASRVARLLPELSRPPSDEELLRLAQFPEEPAVGPSLQSILQNPASRTAAVESLLKVRTRIDGAKLGPLLTEAAQHLLKNPATVELGTRLAGSFQLTGAEPDLVRLLESGPVWSTNTGAAVVRPSSTVAVLGALREIKSDKVELFAKLATHSDPAVQEAAVAALAAARDAQGQQKLAGLYPALPAAARKTALAGLSSTKPGAHALVKSIRSGGIARDELDGATFDKLQTVLGVDPDLNALMQEMQAFFRPALRLNGQDNAWCETGVTLEGPFTVETWVKLDPGIDNNDGLLGAPGTLDMNFFDGRFRVWVGGGVHDAIVAKKKMIPDAWTHLAVTRDASGQFRIFLNGELETDQGTPVTNRFEGVRLAWTAPGKGTAGWLSEFRIWNRARSTDEIRADFDRSFDDAGDAARPAGLVARFAGTSWGKPHSGAKVQKTQDYPPLLSPAEARAMAEKFSRFHALAERPGNAERGRALFTTACLQCHSVAGRGGQVGPVLNGAGALGVESLLRNLLTPNAAMEPGYRVFRVELKDGEVLDGIRVSEDKDAIVLRRPNVADTRIAQKDVRKAGFTRSSMMPEGLLDAFAPADVSDLFAYLKALK